MGGGVPFLFETCHHRRKKNKKKQVFRICAKSKGSGQHGAKVCLVYVKYAESDYPVNPHNLSVPFFSGITLSSIQVSVSEQQRP